jgi:hypothetical protein
MKKIFKILVLFVFVFFIINAISILLLNSNFLKNYISKKISNEILIEQSYFNPINDILLNKDYINEMLYDNICYMLSTNGTFIYYPFVEFSKSKFKSSSINILNENSVPHRKTFNVGKNDSIIYKIFCFGGSTTYGDFIKDDHTWPSFISKNFNNSQLEVLNYGCEAYTPYQETLLFLSLLRQGKRPSLSIFMDGINTGEITDGTEFSYLISPKIELFNTSSFEFLIKFFTHLPISKLLFYLNLKLINNEHNEKTFFMLETNSNEHYYIINQFINNAKLRKAIADLYEVDIIQILQPNSLLGYNINFLKKESLIFFNYKNNINKVSNNYKKLYSSIIKEKCGYIDLSYPLYEYKKPALVDGLHYSPDFNNYLAKKISNFIKLDKLKPYYFDLKNKEIKPFPN